MAVLKEFKEFAMKGNVIDLAVGIVIGAAFSKIVTALVENIIMPVIGVVLKGVDFTKLAYPVPDPLDPSKVLVSIKYGVFIQAVVDFLIIAFALFLMVKGINHLKRQQEKAPPAEQPADVKLLTEIRDLLKVRT